MEKLFKVIFMVIQLVCIIACEEDEDEHYIHFRLYIDESCNQDRLPIEKAINNLNEFTINLIHQPMIDLVDEEDDKVICYHEEPDWFEDYDDQSLLGETGTHLVRVFLFQPAFEEDNADDVEISLFMHEFMHYIGIHSHSDDENAVMFPWNTGTTVYNSSDEELFCSYYNLFC